MSDGAQPKDLTPSDSAYLIQCLQNGNSSMIVNVTAIALDLSTKPHNVTCRISSLRKKYGLNIICTSNVAGAGSSSGTASAAKTRQASSSAAAVAAAAAGGVKTGRVGKPSAEKKKNGVGFGNGVSFGGRKKTTVQVRTVREVFVDDDEEGEDGKVEGGNEGEGEAGTSKTKKTKGNSRVDPDTERDKRSDADGQAGAVVKMEKTEDRRTKSED